MMRRTWWFSVVLVGSVCACAEPNAVLEVEMALTPMDVAAALDRPVEDVGSVWVQVAPQEFDFDSPWTSARSPFVLTGVCDVKFSVVADTPRSDRRSLGELRLRLWFCPTLTEPPNFIVRADDCTAQPADLEITLQQPLYPGEQTRWRFGNGACGATPTGSTFESRRQDDGTLLVDRCQILRGCQESEAFPAAGRDYCNDDTRRTHICD